MTDKVTIPALHQMKRDGQKIVGVVAWDYQIAQIVDRAGVEIVSVGDTVGINLLDHLPAKYRCIAFGRRETGHSGGRYMEECIPGAEYWDMPVDGQTEETAPKRILEFLDGV